MEKKDEEKLMDVKSTGCWSFKLIRDVCLNPSSGKTLLLEEKNLKSF